ncbi:SDR family oxidoreductase [Sphingopyxis sp.]|uniref:SDR family oxidoreductase n=1 Tax=Sphingopyxis sp. TaxID=1908224 RepID=UPI003D6D038F
MPERMRTAVITGSASGIGLATAAYFRRANYRVIGVDLQSADIISDLSSQEGRAHASARILELAPDGIDAVIPCAGIGGGRTSSMMVSAVNFFGTTRLLDLLRPQLALGTDARVVIVSSSTAILAHDPVLLEYYLADDEERALRHSADPMLTYSTGKRALCHWMRSKAVSAEWAGSGIHLNAVAPGVVVTPLTQSALGTAEGRAAAAAVAPIVLPSYPSPAAIAPLIAFLACAENSNMIGQIVFSDGGSEVLTRGPAFP